MFLKGKAAAWKAHRQWYNARNSQSHSELAQRPSTLFHFAYLGLGKATDLRK